MTMGVLAVNLKPEVAKIERESGQNPSRLRMTGKTIESFRYNKDNGLVDKLVDSFNQRYVNIRQALVVAENERAEKSARDEVLQAQVATQPIQEIDLKKIQADNAVAFLSSYNVVMPKLAHLKMEPAFPGNVFPTTDGKTLVCKSASNWAPKAIMVPELFTRIYKRIAINSNWYKFSNSLAKDNNSLVNQEQGNQAVMEQRNSGVASWRKLFGDENVEVAVKASQSIQENSSPERNEGENLDLDEKSHGITEEELADRKLKAQIGDELSQIRRLSKGVASSAPFNSGLVERENMLLQMLSGVTGIPLNKRELKVDASQDLTEFQKLIDSVVGFRRPLSEEERIKKEEEIQAHYSDPFVQDQIHRMQEESILYDFNRPEAHDKVMAAERRDNELRASTLANLELLSNEQDDFQQVDEATNNRTVTALEETQTAVDTTSMAAEPNIVETTQVLPENPELTQEPNQKPADSVDNEELVFGAEEQARLLKENNDLLRGAEEQAQILKETNDLVTGAEEQAQLLAADAEKTYLELGAEEQAQMLKETNDLLSGAEEQAQLLAVDTERTYLELGAEEQARLLKETNDLVTGAEEQARLLKETNDLLNGAEEQAQMLHSNSSYDNNNQPVGESKQEIVESSDKNYDILATNDRYASEKNPPMPLRVNREQLGRIVSNADSMIPIESTKSSTQDNLISLRDQLKDLGLGINNAEADYLDTSDYSYKLV